MLTETETHLAYKVANAEIKMFPFPHIYLENVFPPDFYKNILDKAYPKTLEKGFCGT